MAIEVKVVIPDEKIEITTEKILENITPEQKAEIYKELVLNCFNQDFYKTERARIEAKLRAQGVDYYRIEQHHEVQTFVKNYKDIRTELISAIVKDFNNQLKDTIHQTIQDTPALKEVFDDTFKSIKDNLPDIIQKAVYSIFMTQLNQAISTSLMNQNEIGNIYQKLGRLNV